MRVLLPFFMFFLLAVDVSAASLCSLSIEQKQKWTLKDSVELFADLSAKGGREVSRDVDWLSRITLGSVGKRLDPRTLRETREFDQAIRRFDRAIRRDTFVRNLLNRRLHFAESDPSIEWVYRQTLRDGLVSFVDAQTPVEKQKIRDRIYFRVHRILSKPLFRRLFQTLNLTVKLPDHRDIKIPTELQTKIMTDGVAAHEAELRWVYRDTQAYVDAYRQFNRTYRVAAFAFSVMFAVNQFEATVENVQAMQDQMITERYIEATDSQLDAMDEGFDRLEAELDRREALNNASKS
ncbi:MAG TPA: hypothetical protein VM432_11095 [Bdellovibrionales bacterium]|nr:hypothetical protein [Bdellovibrionales bacterium]